MHLLQHTLILHEEWRRRILEAEPDLDEDTLLDTLEGLTDLNMLIAETVRSAISDQTLAAALKNRIEEMRDRLTRYERRVEAKRSVALEAMERAGIRQMVQPDFSVSVRTCPPSVTVTDEQQIPEWFFIPQPPRLDRRSLLEALKGGEGIAGAELSNQKTTLSVRTR